LKRTEEGGKKSGVENDPPPQGGKVYIMRSQSEKKGMQGTTMIIIIKVLPCGGAIKIGREWLKGGNEMSRKAHSPVGKKTTPLFGSQYECILSNL